MNQSGFLSDLIQKHLPFKQKVTAGGINFNCPLCVHRGQLRPDTRLRCGVKTYFDGSIKINCFNCKLATKWEPGLLVPNKIKQLLTELGATTKELMYAQRMAYNLANSVIIGPKTETTSYEPIFDEKSLPVGAIDILEALEEHSDNPLLLDVVQYALSRGERILQDGYKYYWTNKQPHNSRLLVPFYHKEKIVGWVGRSIDPKNTMRYFADTQPNYLFNNHRLYDKNRKYIFLVEGVFDALSIDGVATLGAKMTTEQSIWLKESGKQIIVLPDRHISGKPLVDLAVKHDFKVSFPNWDSDIKDANDAVLRYGKLWTIKSIIDNATDNKMKINFLSKKHLLNEKQ
jgi:hypothetical protein